MEKGTVGSASLPLPAALSGEAEASALTHDPISLPLGHVLLIDQAGFLQPCGSSTSSSVMA